MSAVDTETERLLVENLRPAVAGRTVLVASQRLSTILVADRAVVLVDGRIAEDGTPRELLERGGASPSSSETRPLPRRSRTGLTRLWRYSEGRHRRIALVVALAGRRGGRAVRRLVARRRRDRQRHPRRRREPARPRRRPLRRRQRGRVAAGDDDLAAARRDRPADRVRAAARPLRPPHVALAPLLLRAEGGLDHRPADERRRRALGRAQPGADDARDQLAHAGRRGRSGCSSSTGGSGSWRCSCSRRASSSRAGSSGAPTPPSPTFARESRPSRRSSPSRSPAWRSCRRSAASAPSSTSSRS